MHLELSLPSLRKIYQVFLETDPLQSQHLQLLYLLRLLGPEQFLHSVLPI